MYLDSSIVSYSPDLRPAVPDYTEKEIRRVDDWRATTYVEGFGRNWKLWDVATCMMEAADIMTASLMPADSDHQYTNHG